MDILSAIADAMRILNEGGSWRDVLAAPHVMGLLGVMAFVIPATIIALGIGMTEFHETPLGQWFGVMPPPDDEPWAERARDLDKDGLPDI